MDEEDDLEAQNDNFQAKIDSYQVLIIKMYENIKA